MRDDDREHIQLDVGNLWKRGAQLESVRVSVNRGYRGERAQLDEEVRGSDVSPMEDVVDFAQYLEHARPQHAVRIRDDAKSHGACDAVTQKFSSTLSSPPRGDASSVCHASVGRSSLVPSPAIFTRTGISNPGTTFAQRYDSVVPCTRYSNAGILVVVRYCANTLLRSIPAPRLM